MWTSTERCYAIHVQYTSTQSFVCANKYIAFLLLMFTFTFSTSVLRSFILMLGTSASRCSLLVLAFVIRRISHEYCSVYTCALFVPLQSSMLSVYFLRIRLRTLSLVSSRCVEFLRTLKIIVLWFSYSSLRQNSYVVRDEIEAKAQQLSIYTEFE